MSTSLPGGWFESGHGAIAVFVKDFRDPLERKKKLMLRPWASIKDIKDQLQVVFNVPPNAQKLFFQGRELKNQHNLQQCGIYQDNAVLDFVARRQQALSAIGVDPNAAATAAGCTGAAGARKPSPENLLPHQMPMLSMHPYGAQLLPVTLMKVMHQVRFSADTDVAAMAPRADSFACRRCKAWRLAWPPYWPWTAPAARTSSRTRPIAMSGASSRRTRSRSDLTTREDSWASSDR